MTAPQNARRLFVSAAAVAVIALVWSAVVGDGDPDLRTQLAVPGPVAATKPARPAKVNRAIDSVVVITYENKDPSQIRRGAPYLWSLGRRYASFPRAYGVARPSQPNYVAMMTGGHYVRDNKLHVVRQPDVLSTAYAKGRTAKVYAEHMGFDDCRQGNFGRYAARHNYGKSFIGTPAKLAYCEENNIDERYLAADVTAGRLPNIAMIVPDNCSNAHDCSLGRADAWFARRIALIQAGPQYRAGRVLIVVTGDEGRKGSRDNALYTAAVHPALKGRGAVRTRVDTYSLNRMLWDMSRSPHRGRSTTATDLLKALALTVRS